MCKCSLFTIIFATRLEITQSVTKYYAENGDVAMDTSEDQPDQGVKE